MKIRTVAFNSSIKLDSMVNICAAGSARPTSSVGVLHIMPLYHLTLWFCWLQDSISRTYSSASMSAPTIMKAGWLYKGPDSGRDAIISFTRVRRGKHC